MRKILVAGSVWEVYKSFLMSQKNPQIRPTSPHLSIYRWQISSVMSISHRMTGIALAGGSLLLVAWLWAAAYSAPWFECIHECLSSPFGQVLLYGWAFAFYYHLANGLRHLWWDMGRGFEISEMHRTGWTVVLFAFVMTAATWYFASQPQTFPYNANEKFTSLPEQP